MNKIQNAAWLRLIVALSFLALNELAKSVTADTTYYVDQSAGNDANNGGATAQKNCPGLAAWSGSVELKPGDTVMFDRGDTWEVTGQQGLYLTGGVTFIGDEWGTGSSAELKAVQDVDAGVIRFRNRQRWCFPETGSIAS